MRPSDQQGEGLHAETLAGEAREAFSTADFGKRLHRYGTAKQNAAEFGRYLVAEGETDLANALARCGNLLAFRDYWTVGQIRLSQICTCQKHLICPLCAIRRGAKAVRVYSAKVGELLKADPTLGQYMVTFTVKNGDDLGERFRHLSACLRTYHRRRSRARQHGEVRKASAAVWSYEFTNKGAGWHPHVHAIWLCRDAPDMYRLRDEWHAITGDSFMVDVAPMDQGDPLGAFLEVFKYAVKFAALADPDRLHAYKRLKGKRLQGSLGDLRGLDVEPADSDELLEELPFIERLFRFVPGRGYVGASQVVAA
jgi:hypothetical protein